MPISPSGLPQAYQLIEDGYAAKIQRTTLNFSTAFSVNDNPGNNSTDVDLSRGGTIVANYYPGADIGAQINAAMASLTSAPNSWDGYGGTVLVLPGTYSMTTPVTVDAYCTLRLSTDCNIVLHTTNTSSHRAAFMMQNYSSLIGDNWSSSITESDQTSSWRTVCDYNYGTTAYFAPGDVDGTWYWSVKNIQFIGGNPLYDSAQSTIAVGNSHYVYVENVLLNATRSLGVTLGGTSNPVSGISYYSEECYVIDSVFKGITSQNVSCVNGKNATVSRNTFLAQTGANLSVYIDFEPNDGYDLLENFTIADNIIDNRGSLNSTNGIVVQIGGAIGSDRLGPGTISGNTILGRGWVTYDTNPPMSNGITVAGIPDVDITGNSLRQFGQTAIILDQTTRCTVGDNEIVAPTASAELGINISSSTQCLITGNNVQVPSNALIGGGETQNIGESGSSDYNTFSGNKLTLLYYGAAGTLPSYYPEIILVGAHSRSFGNDLWGRTDDSVRIVSTQTSAYTAFPNEIVKCDPSGGGFTVTLPTAAGHAGQKAMIKNITTSTNTITIAAAGADTIDGAASITITTSHGHVLMYSDGVSNWMLF